MTQWDSCINLTSLRRFGCRDRFCFGGRDRFRNRRGTFPDLRMRLVVLQLNLIEAEFHASESGLHIGDLGMHLFPWRRIDHVLPEALKILRERVQPLSKVS